MSNLGTLSITAAYVGCIVALYSLPAEAYSVQQPFPGSTLRTNSQACIDKFKNVYDVANQYINGLPPMDSVERLDVLLGGVDTKRNNGKAFKENGSGTFSTTNYSVISTYADPNSSHFRGEQMLTQDWSSLEVLVVNNLMIRSSGGETIRVSASIPGCESSKKAKGYSIHLTRGDWQKDLMGCYIAFNFSYGTSACLDTSKTLQGLANELKASAATSPISALSAEINGSWVDVDPYDSAQLKLASNVTWTGGNQVTAQIPGVSIGCGYEGSQTINPLTVVEKVARYRAEKLFIDFLDSLPSTFKNKSLADLCSTISVPSL